MNENLQSRKKSSGSSGQERKSSGSTRIVKNKCCLEKGEFLRWTPCANRRKEKLKCECAKAYRCQVASLILSFELKNKSTFVWVGMHQGGKKKPQNSELVVLCGMMSSMPKEHSTK